MQERRASRDRPRFCRSGVSRELFLLRRSGDKKLAAASRSYPIDGVRG
jgi:hypothetical protein